MPITAKLSRQFYEKLGDEVTNELVTWLNTVDDSYRQEFKDLFAANFGPLRAEIDARMGQLRAEIDAKMGQLRAEMAQLRADVDVNLTRLRVEISEAKASLVWWMFGFWIGQGAVTIGAIIAARQLFR